MLTSREEPPELINGNGIPLVGIRPITTLILMNACSTIRIVIPAARNWPNGSGAFHADPQSTPQKKYESRNNTDAADQPQLFAHNCINKIGMRFGKIKELLNAICESDSLDSACSQGDQGLRI